MLATLIGRPAYQSVNDNTTRQVKIPAEVLVTPRWLWVSKNGPDPFPFKLKLLRFLQRHMVIISEALGTCERLAQVATQQ